jgi:hypothetical protein
MLDPNQGMGKGFIILTHSNYPFCKKISGRWDKFLKATLLTPSNIPLMGYGQIYHPLSRPL